MEASGSNKTLVFFYQTTPHHRIQLSLYSAVNRDSPELLTVSLNYKGAGTATDYGLDGGGVGV
jgi:hypothetical protein